VFSIISKTILCFTLFFGLCLCFGCNQNSIVVSESALASQPTLLIVAPNANVVDDTSKYYFPAEDCAKIKLDDERSLCEAIVKDQDLTNQALDNEFVYASRRIDLNGDG
jgi:hypothetical protein